MHVRIIYNVEIIVVIKLVVYPVVLLGFSGATTIGLTWLTLSTIWIFVPYILFLAFILSVLKLILLVKIVIINLYFFFLIGAWSNLSRILCGTMLFGTHHRPRHLVVLVILYAEVIQCAHFRLRALYLLHAWFLFTTGIISDMRCWRHECILIEKSVRFIAYKTRIILNNFHHSICRIFWSCRGS